MCLAYYVGILYSSANTMCLACYVAVRVYDGNYFHSFTGGDRKAMSGGRGANGFENLFYAVSPSGVVMRLPTFLIMQVNRMSR